MMGSIGLTVALTGFLLYTCIEVLAEFKVNSQRYLLRKVCVFGGCGLVGDVDEYMYISIVYLDCTQLLSLACLFIMKLCYLKCSMHPPHHIHTGQRICCLARQLALLYSTCSSIELCSGVWCTSSSRGGCG